MNLREIRKKRKISLVEFARKVGKSQAAIGFWEIGSREPSLTDLIKMADILEVTTDELLGRIPNFEDTQGDLKDLLIQYRKLTPDGQADIVQYAKFVGAKESAKD